MTTLKQAQSLVFFNRYFVDWEFCIVSKCILIIFLIFKKNSIAGVMVSVLASSVVDPRFEPWSGKTKDY